MTHRMTRAQQAVLDAADTDTRRIPENMVDGRSMRRLARNGWAVRVVDKKRGRKVRYRWDITDSGLEARANAEIVELAPRPNWRHWNKHQLSANEYVVEGHTISRPAQTMLWRLFCPAHYEPIGHEQFLAEAAELLTEHLVRTRDHGTPRDPYMPVVEEPIPGDLDRVAEVSEVETPRRS